MDREQLDVLQALREVEDRDDTAEDQVRHLRDTLHIDRETVRSTLERLVMSGHVEAPDEAADATFALTDEGRRELADGPES